MIDPLVSLAFAIHGHKGAYALLLGSGVSRSARIPTGWEVLLDLIRKVAAAVGATELADEVSWYEEKYGETADYSKLLERITATTAERSRILRGYFEPSADERERGEKRPQAAHRAIADLAGSGYIRLIITTNFDRLLEDAMAEAGVRPVVVSGDDDLKGAFPLIHSSEPWIVKIHGDYLDSRLKNTDSELSKYSPILNKFLDRVFDEFGLVVCGWSGDWDTALRNAIKRCSAHRFGCYWAKKGHLTDKTAELVKWRRAEVLDITDADTFFTDLAQKIDALEAVSRPHPLSVAMAQETVKRYLSEDRHLIALHDLVMKETEKVYKHIENPYELGHDSRRFMDGDIDRILSHYEAVSETLTAMAVVGGY